MKKNNPPRKEAAVKKAPLHGTKSGPVQASVFLNQTKDGTEFPSVVITRRYKGQDGTWKSSDSYGAKHLKNLAEVVVAIQQWFDENHPDAAGE